MSQALTASSLQLRMLSHSISSSGNEDSTLEARLVDGAFLRGVFKVLEEREQQGMNTASDSAALAALIQEVFPRLSPEEQCERLSAIKELHGDLPLNGLLLGPCCAMVANLAPTVRLKLHLAMHFA